MFIHRLVFVLLIPAVSACGSDTGIVAPSETALTPDVAAAVTTALQDEYHAEQTYRRVIADFGAALPFANIVTAEQCHAASLAGILSARGIDVPASDWTLGNVPQFASVVEACAVAAEAEIANIALYDALLAIDLPADVRAIFTNNRRASLDAHLPAFSRCR